MELRLVRQRRAPGPLLILAEVVPFAERLLDYAAGDDRCLNLSRHRSKPSSRFHFAKLRLTTIPCHQLHARTARGTLMPVSAVWHSQTHGRGADHSPARRRLERRAKAQKLSVSPLVRRALEQDELLTSLASAHAELLPQARAQGIYTDEDVFAIVS